MSRRYRHRFERRERDCYATPLTSLSPLIPHRRAGAVRRFAEPCTGDGDLIRHLESFGLRCGYQGDIAFGRSALGIERFDDPVITNTPYDRPQLLALLSHFLRAAPFTWLLLPADFAHVAYARPWPRHCTDIVPEGRAKWFGGSGTENICWFRFERGHTSGPIFRIEPRCSRTLTCLACGTAFRPVRADARFCCGACRQRAYRMRLAVTQA